MDLDRSSIVLYGFRLGMSLVGFLGTVYFVREYGPGVLGVYVLFEGLMNVSGIFTRLGVNSAIEKRISEYGPDESRSYLSSALLISSLPLVVIGVIALIFRSQLKAYVGVPAAAIFVLAIVANTTGSIALSALRAERRIAMSAGLEFFGEAVRVGASVFLLLQGWGAVSLLYGVLIAQFLRTGMTIAALSVEFAAPTWVALSDLASFSRYTFISGFGGLLYGWMDTLTLGFFVTKELVGVYESAWKISVVTMLASQAVAIAVFPSISKWHAEGKIDYIENAFTEGTTYAFILVIPAFVGTVVLKDYLMSVIYQYQLGAVVLILLVGEKLFQAINQIAQRVLLGMNRPDLSFRSTLFMIVVNVALNLLLVPLLGLIGAAVATMATSFTTLLVTFIYLRGLLTVRLDWRRIGWQVASALLMGAALLALDSFVTPDSMPKLLFTIGLGAVVYGGAVLLNEGMRRRLTAVVT